MKSSKLIIGFIFATAPLVSAITETDLSAAAIAGKTLTFTIKGGVAPFPTSVPGPGRSEPRRATRSPSRN